MIILKDTEFILKRPLCNRGLSLFVYQCKMLWSLLLPNLQNIKQNL